MMNYRREEKPVKTYAVGESMRKRIFAFLQKNVSAGMQAYVVCPLIEETETSDLQNAEMLAEKLQTIFPEFKIGLMHGKMKAKLKEEVMDEFVRGEINILVSTTVIEVGVNRAERKYYGYRKCRTIRTVATSSA